MMRLLTGWTMIAAGCWMLGQGLAIAHAGPQADPEDPDPIWLAPLALGLCLLCALALIIGGVIVLAGSTAPLQP